MKKILSLVIAISMLLGMMIPMGITASAVAATECATWAEVVAAVEADSAASIKLTADVTADSTIASFAGTFDGNGKTVTVSNTLFAALANGATIKNLTVAGETTSAPFIAVANGTISFTDVTTNVTANVAESVDMAAFIAKVNAEANITFTNCVNKGAVSANKSVGAFIGFSGSPLTATFTNCVNEGTIKSSAAGAHAGGFIGCLEASAKFDVTFDKCASSGSVIGNNEGKLETAGFVAFFSGTSESSITFTDCISDGSLNNLSKNNSDKYSASGYLSRAKSGTISFTNCLSNISSITSGTNRTANYWYYNEGATLNVTNSYYIEGVAASAAETGKDFTAVTADQLKSGEVAYKLGEAWGQKLDLDTDAETAPVIGGEPVYQYPDGRYSNTPWGQGGTDEPDLSERFTLEAEASFGTVTVEGPKYMTVGSSDKITVTFSASEGMSCFGAGFASSDANVVSFPGTVTTETDVAFISQTADEYVNNGYIALSSSGDPTYTAVIYIPVTASTAGTSAITLINDDSYMLYFGNADMSDDYTHPSTDIGYTITVVDENGEGGDEPTEPIVVDTINVNGYVEPTVGASLADSLAGLSVPEGAPYSIVEANWYNDATFENATEETFAAGTTYCLRLQLRINDNCTFADDVVYQINGGTDLVNPNYTSITTFGISYFSVSTTLPAEGGEGGDEPTGNVVTNVNVNGYVAPTVGANLADALANLSVPAGAPYSIVDAYWFNDATLEIATEETFAEGGMYCLYVRFALADGYTLDIESCVYALNGDTTLVLFGSPNYDETVDCDFLLCSITTELGGGEGGEEGGDEPTTPDGTEENPFVIQNKDDVAAILVPAGETYYFIIDPYTYYETAGEDFIGNLIKVIGAGATINGNATLDLPTNGRVGWPVHFSITAGNEDARAEIVVPKGTFNNPDSFDADGKAEVSLTSPKNDFEPYMFIFKADKNGILVVTAPDGTVVTINNLTSYSYGDMGVNTAEVVAGDEIQILIGTEGADAAGTVSVTIVPHLNIAVWTKNGDWVSADELAAMKADFIAYLEKEFDIDTSVLGIEWAELTTDGNKVADLGALVNAGDFDIIVGCGNNVDSTAGVTIVKKSDINTDYVAAGRKVALLDENNALAEYLYDLLTYVAPVEIDKIDVSGITAPEYGKTVADYKASFVPKLPEGANYSVVMILWFELDPETMEGNGVLADDYVFDSSKTYGFGLGIEANDGYTFADGAVITANGGALELYASMAEGPEAALALIFNPVPDTGDNSAIAIFAIAAVATIGCVALALRKKKED